MRSEYRDMTLLEIYYDVKRDMEDYFRWQDKTKTAYQSNYEKLGEYLNKKPFLDYSLEDFETALTAIKEEGYYIDNKTVKHSYSEDTIKTFYSNLRSLYKYLVFIGACKSSLFWGTKERINREWKEEDRYSHENVKLQKSLKPLAEKSIFEGVMRNPEQEGEYFGVALMFGLGLRNAEACGARFADIVKMSGQDDFYALRVTNTVQNKQLQTGGKTKNAFRLIPIPDTLKEFLERRKEFILNSDAYAEYCAENKGFNINSLTIACRGNDFKTICTTSDLSRAGKELLERAKVEEDVLKFIDDFLYKDDDIVEKEATAYLFRRNFATMLQILDLTQNEIEYIMGHKIESNIESRNYYSNYNKLYPIKQKMDNRPLFSTRYSSDIVKEVSAGTELSFDNPYKQTIKINPGFGPGTAILNVSSAAPGEELKVSIKSSKMNPAVEYKAFGTMTSRSNTDRTTSVLKAVHHEYSSKKGGPRKE